MTHDRPEAMEGELDVEPSTKQVEVTYVEAITEEGNTEVTGKDDLYEEA